TGKDNANKPTSVHQDLTANLEYRVLFGDRMHEHFFNGGALTSEQTIARYGALTDEIDLAIIAQSARWGDFTGTLYTRDNQWVAERDWILNTYLPQRTDIVFQQLKGRGLYPDVVAPFFNQHGGAFPVDFFLTMAAPAGTTYYTTDGSDPRLEGGALSPTAIEYTGAFELVDGVHIKARTLDGADWSALNQATFVPEIPPPLRITEIMYSPEAPAGGSPYLPEDFEFIELRNIGAEPLDVEGFAFTNGVDFTFPALTVAAGEYILVVRNEAAFATRYDTTGMNIVDEFIGLLDNAGERVKIETDVGQQIHKFDYSENWYPITDAGGFSLSIVDENGDLRLWDKKVGWQPSWNGGGSPGTGDPGLLPGTVVINEALTHTDLPLGDWVELHNPTGADAPIAGWFLSDDPDDLQKYEIQPGTVVLAGGYVTLSQFASFGQAGNPGVNTPFAFSELGEGVYLTAAEGGVLRGYREAETFGAAAREMSFGRHTVSTGDVDFTAMSAMTFGMANAYPEVGPLVINEIMYHPLDGDAEFIELLNVTGSPVFFYDTANPANTWRIDGAIEYAFPTGVGIAAGGYALVVPMDPDVFRSTYPVPPGVAIYGPYVGALDNDSESIKLYQPGDPEPDLTVPWIRIDRVKYDDELPWPALTDGQGYSLNRYVGSDYGNDPANWRTSTS
ncbi:lamin tail domain-containing protein, partial [bacterium]|nr:lamin tail domain-containing protein [bacterium]